MAIGMHSTNIIMFASAMWCFCCSAAASYLDKHATALKTLLRHPPGDRGCDAHLCTLELLRDMLQHAVQVEQNVIQPYLSAYYSIHPNASTNASLLLHDVVIEEMFHLATVANVLNAVGGHPNVDGPEFAPSYPMYFEYLNMTTNLAPFSESQVLAFREIEEAPWGPDNPGRAIGIWYQKIEGVMDYLVSTHGEDYVFTGKHDLQIDFKGASGAIKPVYSYVDAKAAVDGIVRQGEGYDHKFWNVSPYTGAIEHPHYYRFEEIVKGRFYLPSDDTHEDIPTGAALDTDWTAVYNFQPNPKAVDFKDNADIYYKMVIFNGCYSMLLRGLQASFNGAPESLMQQVNTMFTLGQLARELMSMPDPKRPGNTVGLPWEWVNLSNPSTLPCPSSMLSDDAIFV